MTQSLLPGASSNTLSTTTPQSKSRKSNGSSSKKQVIDLSDSETDQPSSTGILARGAFQTTATGSLADRGIRQNSLVRTDPSLQTLHTFFTPQKHLPTTPLTDPRQKQTQSTLSTPIGNDIEISNGDESSCFIAAKRARRTPNSNRNYQISMLTSIQNLLADVERVCGKGLNDVVTNASWVGCVTKTLVMWQFRTELFVINICSLSNALFYQLMLQRFAQFDRIRIEPTGLPINELIQIALETASLNLYCEDDGDLKTVVEKLTNIVVSASDMLLEYFSIEIDNEGNLISLPMILEVLNFYIY